MPRQSRLIGEATARLKLRADLQAEQSLQGLEGFSHVWLIWIFHENRTARFHAKVHPPRLGGESIGLFATRTPHRPNNIGLSLVQLVGIEDGILLLGGIDLMDGTPVLDIKPYLPELESVPDARAGWMPSAAKPAVEVTFTPEAEQALEEWTTAFRRGGRASEAERLRGLIVETIRHDPRPLFYRGDEEAPAEEQKKARHAFRLFEGDVHFRMTAPARAEVFTILQEAGEIPPGALRKNSPSHKA